MLQHKGHTATTTTLQLVVVVYVGIIGQLAAITTAASSTGYNVIKTNLLIQLYC